MVLFGDSARTLRTMQALLREHSLLMTRYVPRLGAWPSNALLLLLLLPAQLRTPLLLLLM